MAARHRLRKADHWRCGCRGQSINRVAVYGPTGQQTSAWQVFGGTSVAAPLVGGIFGNNGGKVNAAKTIYDNSSALFDVTTGSNGTCDPAYLCTGEVGYDGPTGMGTPNGIAAFGK